MNRNSLYLVGAFAFLTSTALADTATEQAIVKLINDSNAYASRELRDPPDTVSKDGSLEFWSSGGLLHEVAPDTKPDEYESINIKAKHIQVITLVPGKVAVAQFYSEGSMHGKNGMSVPDYRTRATQVFVNEDGKWKVRAAHWSPIAGGSGTKATVVED